MAINILDLIGGCYEVLTLVYGVGTVWALWLGREVLRWEDHPVLILVTILLIPFWPVTVPLHAVYQCIQAAIIKGRLEELEDFLDDLYDES